ncbi:unnamed protein product [Cunninghamella echinulata]
MFGMESHNALIISTMRLDKRLRPSVGTITINFTLLQKINLMSSCSVYLDKESVEKAMLLARKYKKPSLKFDIPSTFYLCCAFGPITKSHIFQPYSLFTLVDFDRGRTLAAMFFSLIATSVIKHGTEAKFPIQFFKKCNSQYNGKILSIFQEILDLYDSPIQTIILGDNGLNGKLEILTGLLP